MPPKDVTHIPVTPGRIRPLQEQAPSTAKEPGSVHLQESRNLGTGGRVSVDGGPIDPRVSFTFGCCVG